MLNCFIILLIVLSIPYFFVPYEDNLKEGFRGGRRRSRRNRRRNRRNRKAFRRYRRHHWYNDFYYPNYSVYDYLARPFRWTYNWFNFANCPSGCVANSTSPFGFSCVPDGSALSCRTDYDCSSCNLPVSTGYY
jgi:hypothetical protein